jgi:phospholipid/cholesterol/gamma-HCH transport system substrate-binding protein
MSNATSSSRVETIVGAAVIALAAGFFIYASNVTGAGNSISGGYKVVAEFDNAAGINVGTDVRLAGIKIGTVTGQSLNPENYMARVEMMLDPAVSLSDDTAAKITSEGLLGGQFITMEPGGSETKLAEGSVMNLTQGAVDIWSLISQAMFDRSKPASDAPATSTETPPTEDPALRETTPQ